MSYPLSSPVVEGQATEAAQYNNLRSDALYLGGDPAASGSLRDLLFSSGGDLALTLSGKTSIILVASSETPVGLMIGGTIYAIENDLTLTISGTDLPAAGRYNIYAVGGSDGTFTLSLTARTPSRAVGVFCWDGSGVIPGTLHNLAEQKILSAPSLPGTANGRLTLVASDPCSDSDIDQATELYFIPYKGDRIGLYLFGQWEYFRFTNLSLGKTGLIQGIPYDVFLSIDSDGLKLSAISWGSTTIRPVGMLAWVNGVRVNGSDSSKRYLGSFVINENGYFEDSRDGRLIWNENNRIARPLLKKLQTSKGQGAAHMGSWAPYYDEDAPQVRLLVPVGDCDFELSGVGINSLITESDAGYNRAAAIGIIKDCVMTSPYTGNKNAAAAFTHTCGKGPVIAELTPYDSSLIGVHSYTLGFWSNYTYYPIGTGLSAGCGEVPGLYGKIEA